MEAQGTPESSKPLIFQAPNSERVCLKNIVDSNRRRHLLSTSGLYMHTQLHHIYMHTNTTHTHTENVYIMSTYMLIPQHRDHTLAHTHTPHTAYTYTIHTYTTCTHTTCTHTTHIQDPHTHMYTHMCSRAHTHTEVHKQ